MIGLLEEPTIEEISNILYRVRRITRYHSLLYRKLFDIVGYSKRAKDVIPLFMKWTEDKFGISRFNILMYLLYIRSNLNLSSVTLMDIINFVNENHCIYYSDIADSDFYDRFNTEEDAVKWIIAYRTTKIYFLNKFKDCSYESN